MTYVGFAMGHHVRHLFERIRRTERLVVLREILRRIPFEPAMLSRLCFLRFDGVPHVPPGMLRGPGTVRAGTVDDIEGMVRLRDTRAAFLERFAIKDHCVVAVVGGTVVGYEWFCDKPVHLESVFAYLIQIPAGYLYAYDAYVDPHYRNSGFWLRFKAHVGGVMIDSGKTGVLTFVEFGNWPSFRSHLKFGFRPSWSVLAVRVFGRTLLQKESTRPPAMILERMCRPTVR